MLDVSTKPWTVSQAKTHLSALLRRAKSGQPQIIGAREQYVLLSLADYQNGQRPPIGDWLIEQGAKFTLADKSIELPPRHERRDTPFAD